jgi:predicted DNA-binding transcriptional regulator AlpA
MPVDPMTVQPLLLKAPEAARLLGISVRTLFELAAKDPTFPPSVRVRRARRWLLEELSTWCKDCAVRDTPPPRRRRG